MPAHPEITVPDLLPAQIEKLHSFAQETQGPFTIHVVPEKSWYASLESFFTEPFKNMREKLSVKNMGLTLFSTVMSFGWVSYLLCGYIIYKTYKLLKTASAWVNWCSDDELLSDDYFLYRKFTMQDKKAAIQKEKAVLLTYLQLDALLRKYLLRHYFPHNDQEMRKRVTLAYKKIKKAEELCQYRRDFRQAVRYTV